MSHIPGISPDGPPEVIHQVTFRLHPQLEQVIRQLVERMDAIERESCERYQTLKDRVDVLSRSMSPTVRAVQHDPTFERRHGQGSW